MSFPRQFLQDIQDRLTLSDVIGKRVKVTRAGREFKACCPFHNEKTPSFTINNEKGFYHCFGCGAHGDVIKFVQEHDNLSFLETVQLLAGEAGLQMPEQTPEDRAREEKRKSLYTLLEAATAFFEKTFWAHGEGMSYMRGRGLSDEVMRHFRVGYAPADGQALIKAMKSEGYDERAMVEAGLIRKSTKRPGEHYSFFRDRVIFPVKDIRGRVVAFGGRILPAVAARMMNEPPKYINSSDTPLFQKGDLLYNLSDARPSVSADVPYVVVEGYMDVIALYQQGFKTAVAPNGTALTETQIDILWRTAPPDAKVPIMCFDGDNAGRRAALRAVERILPALKPDHSAGVCFLPQGEDPDSLVSGKGRSAFQEILDAATPLATVLWEDELSKRPGATPEDRAGLQASLKQKIFEIENEGVREAYMSMMMSRFYDHFRGNKKQAGQGNYNGGFKRNYQKRGPTDRLAPVPIRPVRPKAAPQMSVAQGVLACVMNYPTLFDELEEVLSSLHIEDKDLGRLRSAIFTIVSETEDELDSKELSDILDDQGYSVIKDALCSESLYLQAVYARPGQNLDDVREGLSLTLSRMRARAKRL